MATFVLASLLLAVVYAGVAAAAEPCPGRGWSDITTALAMSRVDAQCFADLDYRTVQDQFVAAACAGISNVQLSRMSSQKPFDACYGLYPACIKQMASLAGANVECCKRIEPASCAAVSGQLLSTITSAAYLSAECLQALPVDTCKDMSSALVAQLGSVDPKQCGAIAPVCLGALSGLAFAAMSPACLSVMQALHDDLCAHIAPDQARSMTRAQASALSAKCVASLAPATCAELPVAWLNPQLCGAITGACLARVPSLATVSADCTLRLDATACESFEAAAVATLADHALQPRCLARVPPAVCPAFGSSFLAALGSVECDAVSVPCYLQIPSYASFGHACASAIPAPVIQNASLAQLVSFSPAAVSSFTSAFFTTVIGRFGAAFANAMTPLSVTHTDAAADFVAQLLAAPLSFPLPRVEMAAAATDATWLQIAYGDASVADFVTHNRATIAAPAFQGIRPDQIVKMIPALPLLEPEQVRHLSCLAVNALDAHTMRGSLSLADVPWPRFQRNDQFRIFAADDWAAVWKANPAVNGMACDAILALPDDLFQQVLFATTMDSRTRYVDWRNRGHCAGQNNVAGLVPCSGWRRVSASVPVVPSTTAAPPQTTTPAPTTAAPSAVSWPIIVGSVIGVAVLAAAVAVGVLVWRRRRLASIPYTQLNADEPGVNLGSDW